MQDHGLTQAEVDSLLARRPRSGRVTRTDSAHFPPRENAAARPPDENALAPLQTLHASLAEPMSQLLASRLATKVRVRPIDATVVPAGQLLGEFTGPHVIHVLRARPLPSPWLLATPLPFAHLLLNRLLGGGVEEELPPSSEPLTELDASLLASVVDPLLEQIAAAWRPWLDLSIAVENILADPRTGPIRPPREKMARIAWDVAWNVASNGAGAAGRWQLALPLPALEHLRTRRSAHASRGGSFVERRQPSQTDPSATGGPDATGKLPVLVCLEQSRIRLSDASQLAVGDVIATEQGCHSPLTVYVAGRPRFLGVPASFQGKKVVQIETVLGEQPGVPDEDPQSGILQQPIISQQPVDPVADAVGIGGPVSPTDDTAVDDHGRQGK